MTIIESILLGLIQGLTEFLPVSSSGHLVLAQELLGKNLENATFDVFLHFGTLLSIIIMLRKEVAQLIIGFFRLLPLLFNPRNLKQGYTTDQNIQRAAILFIGTLPAAIIGVLFEKQIEALFNDAKLVSLMLIGTGFILLSTRWVKEKRQILSLPRGLLIGIAQAVAIVPGISRSGSTISLGLHVGLDKKEAVHFSFLLAIPVIFGASFLKAVHLLTGTEPMMPLSSLISGTLTAFVSGCFAIAVLIHLIQVSKLYPFAYYCFIVGFGALGFLTM